MLSLVLLVRCVSGRGMYSFFQNGQKFPPSIMCIFLVFLRHCLIPSVLSICVGDLHGPCVEESPNTPHSRLSLQRHTTQPVLSPETHHTAGSVARDTPHSRFSRQRHITQPVVSPETHLMRDTSQPVISPKTHHTAGSLARHTPHSRFSRQSLTKQLVLSP